MGQYVARDAVRVPGLLSLTRVPLAFVFPWVMHRPGLAISVLAAAALTDVADGWYARRFHDETPMGRVLDPITDKIFVTTVVVSMIASGILSIAETLLIGTRELCEVALLGYAALVWRGRPRPAHGANLLGKAATVMQFATVAAVLMGTSQRTLWILATAICGLVSGASYTVREFRSQS